MFLNDALVTARRGVWPSLFLMSAIPALAWPVGLAFFPMAGPGAAHASVRAGVPLGLSTFLLCVLSVFLLALALHLVVSMYARRRQSKAALALAVDAASPVLLSGVLLVYPPLILATLVAASYGLYLLFLGLQALLGVREGDAAECTAVCAVVFACFSGALGALAGALNLI